MEIYEVYLSSPSRSLSFHSQHPLMVTRRQCIFHSCCVLINQHLWKNSLIVLADIFPWDNSLVYDWKKLWNKWPVAERLHWFLLEFLFKCNILFRQVNLLAPNDFWNCQRVQKWVLLYLEGFRRYMLILEIFVLTRLIICSYFVANLLRRKWICTSCHMSIHVLYLVTRTR